VSVSWYIAKRYLLSHRKVRFLSFITSFAILGVMLGTAALIITLSIVDGFEREIKEKVIAFTSHIDVVGFQNQPLRHPRVSVERATKAIPDIRSIAPYAAKEGMIRFHDAVDGIYLKGIDPSLDGVASRQRLVAGSFLSRGPAAGPELVIGAKLARRINAGVGDRVVIFALPAQTGSGSQPRAMQFRIVGTYESGMSEFDDIYAFTRLEEAQRLFQLDSNVTGYDVLVTDLNRVDAVAVKLQDLLGYPHYPRTVFDLYRNLFSWVELQKKLSPILLSLIILVATINIIGTLLMFVLEKTSAIAILQSLGAAPSFIRKLFILQGLAIAGVGVALGNLLAFAFCWSQLHFHYFSLPADIYYMNSVPILLKPENFLLVTVIALGLCFVTTLIPARAAARLKAVEAFRFG
jgi:lipoprotein-releasing system permease protein